MPCRGVGICTHIIQAVENPPRGTDGLTCAPEPGQQGATQSRAVSRATPPGNQSQALFHIYQAEILLLPLPLLLNLLLVSPASPFCHSLLLLPLPLLCLCLSLCYVILCSYIASVCAFSLALSSLALLHPVSYCLWLCTCTDTYILTTFKRK
jgi:hypothetical protein